MRKRFEWNWEVLDNSTVRAKVVGGWIVLHIQQTFTGTERKNKTDIKIVNSESMVFIADRDHEWAIMPPIQDLPPEKKIDPAAFKSSLNQS